MDALAMFHARSSVRKFTDEPVPRESLELMVDCARLAPTAMGMQSWEFVVITNDGVRKCLADALEYGKFVAQAPAVIMVLCKDSKYYLEDGCNATNTLLLAATMQGLGSCWIAADKKTYANYLRSLIDAPENYHVVSVVAVGFAAEAPVHSPKRTLDEVIHWEKY